MSCVMKKGEILFYSNNAVDINNKDSFIKTIGFPTDVNVNVIFAGSFMPVPKGAKVPEVPAVKEYRFTFEIKNLPQKFFPFLITFYGKDLNCASTQKFNINFHSYNNTMNRTSLITEDNGSKTLVISDTTMNNFGLKNISKNLCNDIQLVAKIVIVYNDC